MLPASSDARNDAQDPSLAETVRIFQHVFSRRNDTMPGTEDVFVDNAQRSAGCTRQATINSHMHTGLLT